MKDRIQNRTERKKAETRKKIMAVAMDLFNRQGFEQTTIDQIAMEADVAKGTIYNHFPEKEAIISEYIFSLVSEQGPDMLALLRKLPDTRSRLITALHKSLEWMQVDLNNDLYEKYFTYKMSKAAQALKGHGPSVSSGFRTVLEQIFVWGKESGEIRDDVDCSFLADQLELNHIIRLIFWVTYPQMSSIHESIEINVELFLNGAKSAL
ncbi:MAG: TetR/AcrR family transcriptional regulator [Syntrophomonadaceae bacterium]|nr:TetR/AcrR family transcriptional regulator [Syntrophomonadaceae bacterium]